MSEMDCMKGKCAIVTGASSGIGRASALKLAKAGCNIVSVARSAGKLAGLAEEIASLGGETEAIAIDVTSSGSARHIVERAIARFGKIDILVNAAGVLRSGSIEDTSEDDWDYLMNINVRAPFLLIQEAMPHLIKSKGNVVNVSSVNGVRAFPGVLAYCVSKAALDQLTHCVSLEVAPKGVRVNAVNPGVTTTNLHRAGGMDEGSYAAFLERSKTTHPLGRVGQADEVADLVLFLASPKAGWITGASYAIDGGRGQTCLR